MFKNIAQNDLDDIQNVRKALCYYIFKHEINFSYCSYYILWLN